MRPRREFVAFVLVGLAVAAAIVIQSDRAHLPDGLRYGLARLLPMPATTWPMKNPADVGFDPDKLEAFRRMIGRYSSGSVIKDGFLVYAWGEYDRNDDWGSATKPILSTLMLFALHENRIGSVDELISEHWPALRETDRSMTFRHLANNTSGYTLPETPDQSWAYNDFGMKLYFLTVLDAFGTAADDSVAVEELLAAAHRLGPLAFEDGQLFITRKGVPRLSMSPRDYARVGWFWLKMGNWNGRQILPRTLFERFLQTGVPADLPRTSGGPIDDYLGIGSMGAPHNDIFALGPGSYGFAWWFNTDRRLWSDLPGDAFQANGRENRQAVTVIPSLGIVVAWVNGAAVGSSDREFNVPMNAALKALLQAL